MYVIAVETYLYYNLMQFGFIQEIVSQWLEKLLFSFPWTIPLGALLRHLFYNENERSSNFVNSYTDDAHIRTYHRTFVNKRRHDARRRRRWRREGGGSSRGDAERTREANNPNFIVRDLHSESHYQTTVPHARYNYAGVAQHRNVSNRPALSLSPSLVLLSRSFSSTPLIFFLSSSLFPLLVLTSFICTRFAPITCSDLYARSSLPAHFAFFPTDYTIF